MLTIDHVNASETVQTAEGKSKKAVVHWREPGNKPMGAFRTQRDTVVLRGVGRQPLDRLPHSRLNRVPAVRAGRDRLALLEAGLIGAEMNTLPVVTAKNYFDPDIEMAYMGSTQVKNFMRCEAAELARLKGEYRSAATTAMLVGSYVDGFRSPCRAGQAGAAGGGAYRAGRAQRRPPLRKP